VDPERTRAVTTDDHVAHARERFLSHSTTTISTFGASSSRPGSAAGTTTSMSTG
jgi:hypothetical protein